MYHRFIGAVLTTGTLLLGAYSEAQAKDNAVSPSEKIASGALSAEAGMLKRLRTEAEIAAEHARYAQRRPDDIAWVHRYMRHVRHALDPSSEPDGPGLNYGVLETSERLKKAMAARLPVLSKAARVPAETVRAGAANASGWASEIMALSGTILVEESTNALVNSWTKTIEELTAKLLRGSDSAPGIQQAREAFARLNN